VKLCTTNLKLNRTIIIGDFNAHIGDEINPHDSSNPIANDMSRHHCTAIKRSRAQQLRQFCQEHNMRVACFASPNAWTFSSANHTDKSVLNSNRIDTALIGRLLCKKWSMLSTLETDAGHKPIILHNWSYLREMDSHSEIKEIVTYKYDRISEDMFTELGMLTRKLGNNWQLGDDRAIRAKMNTLTNATMEALLAAQEKVTVKKRHRTGPGATTGMSIMARIEATILKIKQLRNKRMHLKLMSSGPSGRRGKRVKANSRIGKRQARLKTKLKWLINSKFYSNTRQTTHNSASPDIESEKLWFKWQLAKNQKENSRLPGTQNQNISNSGQSNEHEGYEMDQQQINEMAERLFPEGQLGKCLHEIAETEENNGAIKEQRSGGTARPRVKIGEGEIKEAIKKHRNKKYTGPEGLKFATFNHAVKFIYNTLAILARMSYHTSTVPDFCRLNQGTLIPKKEKGKFRIVHICSPITAFLETIALHRLEHLLDDRGLIDKAQFGFTANRSRIDLIACLITCIFKYDAYTGKNQQHSIIALDISGAFDNVAHTHLIGKLNRDLDGDQAELG